MPAPYSDDMYTAEASDDEQDTLLSPADGYFHASSSSQDAAPAQEHAGRTSAQVPSVPDVLVEDPTLREQGGAKAREAEEEWLSNEADASEATSPRPAASNPSPLWTPRHHNRRSVEEDEPIESADRGRSMRSLPYLGTNPHPPQSPPSQTTGLFQHRQRQPADAPPAYTPSPTSPLSAQSGGYQTFPPPERASIMGLPSEQQRLLPREPESMGGSPDARKPSRWQKLVHAFRGSSLRKKIRTLLGVLVVLSIIAVLVTSFIDSNKVGNEPIKKPNKDHEDFRWRPDSQCLDDPYTFPRAKFVVEFQQARNLSIIQRLDIEDGDTLLKPHVTGEVILRPVRSDAAGTIDIDVIANDRSLEVDVEYRKEKQVIEIITPRSADWAWRKRAPCIQIRVTVWVPGFSHLENLRISSVNLDVDILTALILNVENEVLIETVAGNITAANQTQADLERGILPYALSSRRTIIETVSGDIDGYFPLYDLLKITTSSGDVDVSVEPQNVHIAKPESAVLDVASVSGQIKVNEHLTPFLDSEGPNRSLPPRDYVVKASTVSGSIEAEVAISSLASFETKSGAIKLRLLPVLDVSTGAWYAQRQHLTTKTTSGKTEVALIDPLWTRIERIGAPSPPSAPTLPPFMHFDDDLELWPHTDERDPYIIIHPHDIRTGPADQAHQGDSQAAEVDASAAPALSWLTSKHISVSGSIKLAYPSAWEGTLWADTISGTQNIRGEGLDMTHPAGAIKRRIVAHKGSGHSDLVVTSISGNEDVLIGNAP
ncbi:hypothetical protein S40293_03052 [Stachybotrys chartarum IBT 40293]|nr:hypothetical protein S40293_03052 [Stachybotrys chartarum IBT 40293]